MASWAHLQKTTAENRSQAAELQGSKINLRWLCNEILGGKRTESQQHLQAPM